MSDPAPAAAPARDERTFRAFTKDQGANYAQHRRGYHPKFYKDLIDRHTSTGGELQTLLDVGCGPGTATLALAPQFKHVIGLDPSEGMISTARSLASSSPTPEHVRFEISKAEDLGSHLSPPIQDASIDLITAATAAHWFDMTRFWAQAARVLKPGGTVALWTVGDVRIDPSMPNAAAIQAACDEHEERYVMPFYEPGNFMCRNLYIDLPLPWTVTPPVADFEKASFHRQEWGPENAAEEFFEGGGFTVDFDKMEMIYSTASPIQRWREAHPDAVGTEKDVIRMLRRKTERLLHEAGVEKGKEMIKGNVRGVLIMVKKKS